MGDSKPVVKRTLLLVCLSLASFGAGVALQQAGCSRLDGGLRSNVSPSRNATEKVLTITWLRLLNLSGETCNRCGNTERAIDDAEQVLAAALKPLGLRVSVVKSALKPELFTLDTSQSNQIWIGKESLDTILGAKVGASPCAGVCGGSSCRTIVVDGRTYETIPSELIIRAGLKVAADMIQPEPTVPNDHASLLPITGGDIPANR